MKELLAELRRRDIRLRREGNDLRFNAPPGALSPELRKEIAANKSALLAALPSEALPVAQADRRAPFPLSFSQERLWILDDLEPGLPTYNVPHCWRLSGTLNIGALEKALNEIGRRHEILRTTFHATDGAHPIQTVHDHVSTPLAVIPASPDVAERLASEEASRPFALAVGPLWRRALLALGADDHILLVTFHHIVSDAWSVAIFTRELAALYRAYSAQLASPLPELAMQYADYARWQREVINEDTPQLDYWSQRLAGNLAPTELPSDRARPLRQTYRGAAIARRIPGDVSDGLRRLAKKEEVTLFMLLLAAFKALLVRYTGSTDIFVGTPIAQRPRLETENLIGFFLNTLALRTDLEGDPTFQEIIKRVRSTTLDAFAHQDVPFEKVVERLQPPRSLSHHPIFQVAFVLHPPDDGAPTLDGLCVESFSTPTTTSKFDLTLFVVDAADGLEAKIEFSTDLFDGGTIDRLLDSLALLLRGVVADPSVPLSGLPLLSDQDRHRVLVEWNRTTRPCPLDRSVASLFEERASLAPDAVAIIDGRVKTTYAELNERAELWANDLRARGVTNGSFVGVEAVRSAAFIERMLGILKAGGAYVPLSPDDPAERKTRLRAECSVVLDLVSDPTQSAGDSRPAVSGDSAAYVLYTSGSTGTPKGVVVPHRAIARLVLGTDFVQMRGDDVVALASNLCFDAATFEIWGALLNGGTLVVTSSDVLISPTAFFEHLSAHRITTIFLTTSLFNQMARQAPAIFARLRNVVFGGEAADPQSVALVLANGRPQRLVNGYGPTETTTFAVCHVVEEVAGPRIPIGRPIANTTAYILDQRLNPVPIGVTGELFIGGPGVAIGYHGSPELTAERFIDTPMGRLYRTGDRVRWLSDGRIDYLGRADRQIKLRGFRIEPGEIESAMQNQQGIAECIVRACIGPGGEQRLVAWFRPSNGRTPPDNEITAGLARALPDYMLPAAFVPVQRFPLTANGKLDVDALPIPCLDARVEGDYVAPKNSIHGQLAEIWQEVLGIPKVGIHDDFFALGGHSLLAARMLALIEGRLGLRLPLAALFERATIENIGRNLLERRKLAAGEAPYVTMHPDGRSTPFFFLHGDFVGGGIFTQSIARHIGTTRPVHAIHPHGLRGDLPPCSIERMASERVETIRALQSHGPYLLGGYCNGALVAYEIARRLEAAGEKVTALVLIAADGSNTRYRTLHDWTGRVSRVIGEDDAQTQARFLRWQHHVRHSRAVGLHYLRAFAEIRKLPPAKILARVWNKGQRILRRIGGPTLNDAVPPDAGDHQDRISTAYQDIWDCYVPEPFAGKATLLWPEDDLPLLPLGPTGGWKDLCADIETIIVPGAHHTCITQDANLRVIGEQVRRVLDEVSPPVDPQEVD